MLHLMMSLGSSERWEWLFPVRPKVARWQSQQFLPKAVFGGPGFCRAVEGERCKMGSEMQGFVSHF